MPRIKKKEKQALRKGYRSVCPVLSSLYSSICPMRCYRLSNGLRGGAVECCTHLDALRIAKGISSPFRRPSSPHLKRASASIARLVTAKIDIKKRGQTLLRRWFYSIKKSINWSVDCILRQQRTQVVPINNSNGMERINEKRKKRSDRPLTRIFAACTLLLQVLMIYWLICILWGERTNCQL